MGKPTTPKEAYEMRKAERDKLARLRSEIDRRTQELAMLDMLDRFVTATERIADALEGKSSDHAAAVLRAAGQRE